MRLKSQLQNRLTLDFEYVRVADEREQTVARGEQELASMRRTPGGLVQTPLPEALRAALVPFAAP
jgi:enediyne biosynthesis thioesterase